MRAVLAFLLTGCMGTVGASAGVSVDSSGAVTPMLLAKTDLGTWNTHQEHDKERKFVAGLVGLEVGAAYDTSGSKPGVAVGLPAPWVGLLPFERGKLGGAARLVFRGVTAGPAAWQLGAGVMPVLTLYGRSGPPAPWTCGEAPLDEGFSVGTLGLAVEGGAVLIGDEKARAFVNVMLDYQHHGFMAMRARPSATRAPCPEMPLAK
jgi:hypothetical protein